ncbi:MAG: ornithine carbamoyltransferase [Ferrovum sp.]|jgi:ornithine carbamoyltransferase|nr:ornithine carbamoyltransferase [Ferrovum sp.]
MKHFLQLSDFTRDEYEYLFHRSSHIKQLYKAYSTYHPLLDYMLAMVFEKQSTRTRVSFEAGIHQLGGSSINLTTGETQLGRGEPIEDVARVISRMVDLVMIRTFDQSIIERFAAFSRVPVINGLTNQFHPCQILADVFTFVEHRGSLTGKVVAWIGDGNNMCQTWIQAARLFDFELQVATPQGYEFNTALMTAEEAKKVKVFKDPKEAVYGADLVTTDVWTSMGYEAETETRQAVFGPFQVNEELMQFASSDALFMHCLPAHRGEEVTESVLNGRQSVVWDEAENRLHVQKALMEYLILGRV